MSFESVIDTLEIRNANKISFVGTSSSFVDTTTGRIQTKGFQHNSNVITDISGPHGRIAPTLKKYPEIAFESGKFDSNDSTNTYVQAGYTVTDSSHHNEYYGAWIFDDQTGFVTNKNLWISPINTYTTSGGAGTPTMTTSDARCTTVSGVATPGEWVQLKLPNKVKLSSISIMGPTGNGGTGSQDLGRAPKNAVLAGSVDGTTWNSVLTWSEAINWTVKTYKSFPANVDSTNYYNYFRLIITKNDGTQVYASIQELQLYGYEEDPPAGDHSVDTTFKSRFNNPQLTGVQVLVDGATGVGTNQISGGPDPSGNPTYVTDGKYWTLNGTLTSNLAVEANTFLEGDQPHAVSVWFNSSNLEANVSNTCVFSIASEEKLDSVNLDLQSNTWHNLTYAYQGEGGSRVAYLDGRKVLEDQAEDTFGAYPPFAMTGYSQGGYVVSASNYTPGDYYPWEAFDTIAGGDSVGWYSNGLGTYNRTGGLVTSTSTVRLAPETEKGEWLQLEFPSNFHLNYFVLYSQSYSATSNTPDNFIVYAKKNSSDTWTSLGTHTGTAAGQSAAGYTGTVDGSEVYKYFAIVVTKRVTQHVTYGVSIRELKFYGHRENDLVRLPDPTNVLKYPHIAMTGPAQRGYTTRGAQLELNNDAYDSPSWKAFRGTLVDNSDCYFGLYVSGAAWYYNTDGTFNSTSYPNVKLSSQTPAGDYITLGLPHKLVLNSFDLTPRTIPPSNSNSATQAANESAQSFEIWGSNDNSTWYHINTYDNTSITPGTNYAVQPTRTFTVNWANSTATPNTPTAYKHIGLVVKSIFGNDFAGVRQLFTLGRYRLYGTEENSSIPIQIGGGNIDKVANFRVYDKFVGEDQALEIWDAQKEEFGRAKPQMVLQQGKLGIGTDAPQGSLSVADEPHNLEEFPPRAMTGYKTYFEGHGEFCASVSNVVSTTYTSYKAFNKNSTATTGNWWSQSDSGGQPEYSTSTGGFSSTDSLYSTNVEGANKYGQWLQIEFPYKINYKYSDIQAPQHSIGRQPRAGYIVGSNDLSGIWTSLHRFTNVTRTHAYESVKYTPPTVSTQTFKYFRLVIEEMNNYAYAGIARWDIFGTREQGQSVLHDGQLTLTKSLTVPSIGPSVTNTRHAVPKRHNLVVEFDTSTNPTDLTTVSDTSEMGNDGTLRGNAYYSIGDKAFKFDGAGATYIYKSGASGIPSGNAIFSIVGWVNIEPSISGASAVLTFGSSWGVSTIGALSINTSYGISGSIGGDHVKSTNAVITPNTWHHVATVKKTSTGVCNVDTFDLYVNGVLITDKTYVGSSRTQNIGTGTKYLAVGGGFTGAATDACKGLISNPKLYNVALTAGDVKTLYDMGRGDSYHVTNFQNTLVGINLGNGRAPRSALDVRDLIYAESSSVQTFTGQHICFPDESMETGLIVSAKKNQFVKLNGLATGKSAITIDESLPIVSLSNVAQDKACFGVVSKMEESNEAYRTEITGGLVSESIKIAGDNRAVVNSVGEGAIWVVDTNGPLESGDYITTSNVAGYGQKQDDDVLHNFTVAKITMDCDFTGSNVAVQTIKREQTGTRTITEDAWNQLVEYDRYSNVEDEITTYYQIQRGGNVLDENGQLQFEDKTGATEEPYERRFLTTDGTQTDEANAAHIAAFVGCTYHCG